jgi:hypothetical protein
MAQNIINQESLVPEVPTNVDSQQLYVYVPKATNTGVVGTIAFSAIDFYIDPATGQLRSNSSTEALYLSSDPINKLSLVKVMSDEFVYNDNDPNGIGHEHYEVKFNRDDRDVFTRPDFIMIDTDDFLKSTPAGTQYSKYNIDWPDNVFGELRKQGFVLTHSDFSENAGHEITLKLPVSGYSTLVNVTEASTVNAHLDSMGLISLDKTLVQGGQWLTHNATIESEINFNESKLADYVDHRADFAWLHPNYDYNIQNPGQPLPQVQIGFDGANPIYADILQEDPYNGAVTGYNAAAKRQNYFTNDVTNWMGTGIDYTANAPVPDTPAYDFDRNIMYRRTLLSFDKMSINLGNVENQSISMTIFGEPGRADYHDSRTTGYDPLAHEQLFALKVTTNTASQLGAPIVYDDDIGLVYDRPANQGNTVKENLDSIENRLTTNESMVANLFASFLGDITPPDSVSNVTDYLNNLPYTKPDQKNPDGSYLFTTQTHVFIRQNTTTQIGTNTYWYIQWDSLGNPISWYNTNNGQPSFFDFQAYLLTTGKSADDYMVEDDLVSADYGSIGQPNAFWIAGDHRHKLRADVFRYQYRATSADPWVAKQIKITTIDTPLNTTDFQVDFTGDPTAVMSINIPYTREQEFIHNYNGENQVQASTANFVPGNTTNNLFMRIWKGTSAEYTSQFGGTIPVNMAVWITDDTQTLEGNVIDTLILQRDYLRPLRLRIQGETSPNGAATTGKTYLFNPIDYADWNTPLNWEEVVMTDYLKRVTPAGGINIEYTDTVADQLTINNNVIQQLIQTTQNDPNIQYTDTLFNQYRQLKKPVYDTNGLMGFGDNTGRFLTAGNIFYLPVTNSGSPTEIYTGTYNAIEAELDRHYGYINNINLPTYPTSYAAFNSWQTQSGGIQNPNYSADELRILTQTTNPTKGSTETLKDYVKRVITEEMQKMSAIPLFTGSAQTLATFSATSCPMSFWYGTETEYQTIVSSNAIKRNRVYYRYI